MVTATFLESKAHVHWGTFGFETGSWNKYFLNEGLANDFLNGEGFTQVKEEVDSWNVWIKREEFRTTIVRVGV